jgi:predicted TIM-barrel fold metal-dependent hydrolase
MEMKDNNVIFQIISPTASGLQNLKIKTTSNQVKKATEVNNYIYNKIKNNPNSFKAFATLPMRSPIHAAKELERCVKDLGMVGALVNGSDLLLKKSKKSIKKVQVSLFYDTPNYDVLWKKFEELDVPIYFHPEVYPSTDTTIPDLNLLEFYDKFPILAESSWGFTVGLAQHIMRLVVSGVFDRFPKLKVILGHMGEILPWMAERYDHRLCMYKANLKQINKADFKKNLLVEYTLPKLSLSEYLRKNIYVTTSGWFSNDALEYVIKKMGIERVLFSIDYPYEDQDIACEWMDNVPLSLKDKKKIAYENTAKLLKIKI